MTLLLCLGIFAFGAFIGFIFGGTWAMGRDPFPPLMPGAKVQFRGPEAGSMYRMKVTAIRHDAERTEAVLCERRKRFP